jgi:hypothetical protein
VEQELVVTRFPGIKESKSIDQLYKRQVPILKEKLRQQNLKDIMIEVIYLLKLIIKVLLIEFAFL